MRRSFQFLAIYVAAFAPLGTAVAQQSEASSSSTENLALESTTTSTGLRIILTRRGTGRAPVAGNVIIAHYVGTLADGSVFDSSRARGTPFAFTLGRHQVIAGWDEGFAMLRVGDTATLIIPPSLAYGDMQTGKIPPNSTLRFDVKLVDIKDSALADVLEETIAQHGAAGGQNFLNLAKSRKDRQWFVSESQLNRLGYRYLRYRNPEAAVMVFRWVVGTYPNSANAYDSLGEGYVAAGRIKEAIAAYRQSLSLDPSNSNALAALQELETKRH